MTVAVAAGLFVPTSRDEGVEAVLLLTLTRSEVKLNGIPGVG